MLWLVGVDDWLASYGTMEKIELEKVHDETAIQSCCCYCVDL